MINRKLINVFAISIIFIFAHSIFAQDRQATSDCEVWQRRINPALGGDAFSGIKFPMAEKDKIFAIQCFLKNKGNTNESALKIDMSFNGGRELPIPTVEIAALYYISFLYEEDYEHAAGIALLDNQNRINTPDTIHVAYRAYRKWFKKVKKMGLDKAKEKHISPLQNSNVRWYGC